MRKTLWLRVTLLCLMAAPCLAASPTDWWDANWKARKRVRVELPEFTEPAGLEKLREAAPEQGRLTIRARIRRETAGAPGNNDIRVVDSSGKVVPCRVYALGSKDHVTVVFPGPEKTADYHIYYDNPGAPAPERWLPDARAIEYVAVQTDGAVHFEFAALLKALQGKVEVAVRQEAKDILGSYKVPPRPEGESYSRRSIITSFEGYLLCPVSGRYVFSVDHRGASYVLIDGKLIVEARALYPTPRTWPQPDNVVLTAGYHHLRLLLLEERGTPAIRFGWQMPGTKDIDQVHRRFYADYIDATVQGYERLDEPDIAFFSYAVSPEALTLCRDRTLSTGLVYLVGKTDVSVAYTTLRNLSAFSGEGDVTYTWLVERVVRQPNGEWADAPKPSRFETAEASPSIFLEVGQGYRATLTAFRDGAQIGEYSRLFTVATHDAEVGGLTNAVHNSVRPSIRLEVLSAPNIVYAGEKNNAAFRAVSNLNSPVPVDWETWIERGGRRTKPQTGRFYSGTGKDEIMTFPLQFRDFPDREGTMTVRLSVLETEASRVEFAVRPSPGDFSDLTAPLGYFTGANDQRVILCTTMEDEATYRKWLLLKLAARRLDTGPKRVAVFGAPMLNEPEPGQPALGYVDYLKQLVGNRVTSIDFVRRASGVSPILEDVITFSGWLKTNDPEVAVLTPGLDDAEKGASREDFARGLDVLIDLLRQKRSDVRIFLVSPPPLLSNPELSRLYRDEVKTIAQKHHTGFVDIHSLLLNRPNWRDAYRISPGAEVYSLYPNDAAQKLIAQTIADEL